MISVRGIIQSRTLILEKSNALRNNSISVLAFSWSFEFFKLFWINMSKSTLEKALSVSFGFTLCPDMRNIPAESDDTSQLMG
jgi:hypothetical protein